MPASRILEGKLPEQHPKRQTTTPNAAKTGYQGRSPWLVSWVLVWGRVWLLEPTWMAHCAVVK
jgi:hypothetical protein